jgi:predicted O-methyltransferase YrrM
MKLKQNLHRGLAFLKYIWFSRHTRGHGIHSPFVYEFIDRVLQNRHFPEELQNIEGIRSTILRSKEYIWMNDKGTGRKGNDIYRRSLSEIIRRSSTRKKQGKLLFLISRHFRPAKILELGTSLGIGTMYLGMGCPEAEVVTIEGCKACADIARKNFENLGLKGVKVLTGTFQDKLTPALKKLGWVDLVFIDGAHAMIPTLQNFEKIKPSLRNDTIVIFDDIHWSEEMEKAWQEIKKDPLVKVTIDLYHFGIVFFRRELQRQDFMVRFF